MGSRPLPLWSTIMVLASRKSDVSNETRSEATGETRREPFKCGLANAPGMAEDVGSSMPKTRQSLFKFKHSKHHHTLLDGFDNETIIKVCNVDSKKKNSIGKT
jgi:hypothetical protein